MIAGAQSQVATLWKVNDAATLRLMTAYYERLAAGEPRVEALGQMHLEFLRDPALRHPFYWASFVPIGAWGPVELAALETSSD